MLKLNNLDFLLKKKTFIFFCPVIGDNGISKNLAELSNQLAKKNFKCEIITLNYSGKIKKKFFFNKKIKIIESQLFKFKNKIAIYLQCSLKLLMYSLRKDVIIFAYQANIFAIIISKITFNKIVIRCNIAPSRFITNNVRKIFFKFFYSSVNKILVTSKDFKREFKKYFNLESTILKQSLDFKKIYILSKKKNNFKFFKGFRGLKIINVGRLTDQKNQITLLKAFLKLIKFRPSKLLIVGSGEDKQKLLEFIKKNHLDKFVKIIPFQNNPFKYILMADVKVLTSKFEGNPNILMEIAMLRKLIISSDCKVGPSEILRRGKNGILFKVGKHETLFKILNNLDLKKENIKKKITNSFNYVNNSFQKDVSEDFINIVKTIYNN